MQRRSVKTAESRELSADDGGCPKA